MNNAAIAVVVAITASAGLAESEGEVERNKAVVRRFVDECLNKDDVNAKLLTEIVAADTDNHASGKVGLAAFRAIVEGLRKEAPDQRYTIDALIAEGDVVVARMTRTGTSRLDRFRGYPIAPGHAFTTTHAHFFRIKEGRIVEHWGVRDDLGMAQQLGAIPKPPRK